MMLNFLVSNILLHVACSVMLPGVEQSLLWDNSHPSKTHNIISYSRLHDVRFLLYYPLFVKAKIMTCLDHLWLLLLQADVQLKFEITKDINIACIVGKQTLFFIYISFDLFK